MKEEEQEEKGEQEVKEKRVMKEVEDMEIVTIYCQENKLITLD